MMNNNTWQKDEVNYRLAKCNNIFEKQSVYTFAIITFLNSQPLHKTVHTLCHPGI